jgi:hypothetical protein
MNKAIKISNLNNIRGQAIMVTVTILSLLFIVGVAFFSLAQTERASSIRHLDALRSHYIAEAGIAYARAVLKSDRQANLIDSLEDISLKHFLGDEVDLDGDGKLESRWMNISDSQGNSFGRFSIRICDEASKINLNTTPKDSLEQLFSQLGVSFSANTLISRRPFNAIEQIGSILDKRDFTLSKDYLTVYSRDWETSLERERKTYLNSYSAQAMLQAFLSAGIRSAHQTSANLKDASDGDVCQTRFDRFVRSHMVPTRLMPSGSWQVMGNFYEAPAGGETGKFIWSNLSLEDGEYYCYVYAPSDSDAVGNVYLDESEERSAELLFSKDSLTRKVKVSGGAFTINIQPAKDRISRFSYVELVSISFKNGMSREIITGTEALVINELMVKPSKELLLDSPVGLSPGQSFTHTFTEIKPGNYYVVVLAQQGGGLVGDVSIHGSVAANAYDKQYLPFTVNSTGELTVEIKNNHLSNSSFKGIQVSQQPDVEFIEILNLSGQEIDLSNFSVEVYSFQNELSLGWPGRVPEGTTIKPYQYLVLSADSNDIDCPTQLRNNNISVQRIWHLNSGGLVFDEYSESMNKSFDLLPDKGATVIFKDSLGRQIDAVEYLEAQVQDFVSLERGDPSSKQDSDGDGAFDGWEDCDAGDKATPGLTNENVGMYTRDADNKLIKHTPLEIPVFNRPLESLTEVQQLSEGGNWSKVTVLDLSRMADKFSFAAINLDLSGHYIAGEFKETDNVFESTRKGETGVWEFNNIPEGSYLLSVVSNEFKAEGDQIQLFYKTDIQEEFKNPSLLIFAQGVALFGSIELKSDNSVLQIKIINDSGKKLALKSIVLEPVSSVAGRININTAKQEVLRSILPNEGMVQSVLQNRPLGIKDNLKLGIGQLFLLDPNFIPVCNLLTVRSDIYEINSRGEYNPQGKTLAYQNIRTVVERGE